MRNISSTHIKEKQEEKNTYLLVLKKVINYIAFPIIPTTQL